MGTNYTNNTPFISSISTPSPLSTNPSDPALLFDTNGSSAPSFPDSPSTAFPTLASTLASTTLYPSNSSEINITEYCEFRGKAKIKFVDWGYEQIPQVRYDEFTRASVLKLGFPSYFKNPLRPLLEQNIALNVVAWLLLLLIFSCLRRKAWNHGHLALLKRISKRGSNHSRGEELLQDEEETAEEPPQNPGYNVWVSLFYDPDRRFSMAPPAFKYHVAQAGSVPPTPTGSNPPTPRGAWPGPDGSSPNGTLLNGGAALSPPAATSTQVTNGGAAGGVAAAATATTTPNGGAVNAEDVKIRGLPKTTPNGAPSAATLLRGDGQLHMREFSFSNPRGFFGWLAPIFRLKDKDYREVSGQDAVNYLNFQRYCIVYLAVVTLISCGIILPINVNGNLKTKDQDFGKTTISNLPPDAPATWVSGPDFCSTFRTLGIA